MVKPEGYAIGGRRVTIAPLSPDVFSYVDLLTGEIAGVRFNGTRLKAAIRHLATLEQQAKERAQA